MADKLGCCTKAYPDPDPMFRFIDEDEGPYSFWALPKNLRSQRLRVYLLALSSFEHPFMAWLAAITDDDDRETLDLIHELADTKTDKQIEEQLKVWHAWKQANV